MGMNRTFKAAAAALMLAVSFAGSGAAGPFEDAAAAYEKGDYATALRLMRPLAEDFGDKDDVILAQTLLGVMYSNGYGVPQDGVAAANWYRKAAEQGGASAQYNLGGIYSRGRGVPQDYAAASSWWHKAAEQGHAGAQWSLAHMWLNLAAAGGEAVEFRDKLAKRMTPAQIAEAQKLAREWKPK
jgi:TPR repeat protein